MAPSRKFPCATITALRVGENIFQAQLSSARQRRSASSFFFRPSRDLATFVSTASLRISLSFLCYTLVRRAARVMDVSDVPETARGDGTRTHTRGGRAASISARHRGRAVAEDEGVSASRHTPSRGPPFKLAVQTVVLAPLNNTFLFAVDLSTAVAVTGADWYINGTPDSRTYVVELRKLDTSWLRFKCRNVSEDP